MHESVKSVATLPLKLISAAFDNPLGPPSTAAKELSETFKQKMAAVDLPGDLKVTELWRDALADLKKAVSGSDTREFLTWDATLPLRSGQGVAAQFPAIRFSPRWPIWKRLLKNPGIGREKPFFLYPKSGCNRVLHIHHLEMMEKHMGCKIQDAELVFEFGGGYGGFCHLVHELGFRGRYVIFDLPHQSILQEYYLKSVGVSPALGQLPDSQDSGISLISDLDVAATHLDSAGSSGPGDAWFVANWSLSECPLALRDGVEALVLARFNHWLISFQEGFEGIDNLGYFDGLARRFGDRLSFVKSKMPVRNPPDYYLLAMPKS